VTAPLLKTKLYIPPIRAGLVPRPRLIEGLNAGAERKLTLISAPAGFGKTTLLSSWVHAVRAHPTAPVHVAWVSLDEGDNDLLRFWAYVIAALQTVQRDLGEAARQVLQSRHPPPIQALLTGLINELIESPHPIALILDDFHTITVRDVHDAVTFLVENSAPQTHLILSGRTDPPWPLARMRARGDIVELRADDLRFTPEEVAAFLNDVMGLGLSADEIAALDARTEGWIAGLQMAALSMQGRQDTGAFIRAFSGSHRFVLDYLVEEVLSQQSSDVQAFLLQTSILDRLTAPLCDAVTGGRDSQGVLARLEQANLFLVPLDNERCWYRYHRLFADLLRSRLQQIEPERLAPLHRRASEWYQRNGRIVAAVSHALAAGDVERVAHLVAGNALAIMGHGELTALARRLSALPEKIVRSHPWLGVSRAWVLAYTGQLEAVEARLREVEVALESPEIRTEIGTEARHIAGHIAAIRAYCAGLRGDMSRAAELARDALERLPAEDLMARGFATSLLGSVLRWSGDLAAAARISTEAVAISQAAGEDRVAADTFCDLAALHLVCGQLRRAAATCREALELADGMVRRGGQRLPVTGFAHVRMSTVLREWNDLEAALHHAREGVELCVNWGWADGLVFGYGCLADVLQTSGDEEGALAAIQESIQIASSVSPWLGSYAMAQQARLWTAQGNLSAASEWVRESGLRVDDAIRFQDTFWYLTLARVLLAQGRPEETLTLLTALLEAAESVGATGTTIDIVVLQSLALRAKGRLEESLDALKRALSLAEPEGFVRSIIDGGAPVGELLRSARARGIAVDYVDRLLAALGTETGEGQAARPPRSPLAEPLTEREMEVLRLLTTGLSTIEIAEQLFVTANTIRSHVKNIYRKLSVHGRMEAVQRAMELGLL
jgi:LuxR family maltose regulon positive regulatory protein